jgi:hypothetical protein
MMNSDAHFDPKAVINTLLDLLWDQKIRLEIEQPIELSSDNFEIDIPEPIKPESFNRIIAAFLKHIYSIALRFPRILSDREALAEAIHLLTNYSDAEGPDRYGAILTNVILGGEEELRKVLSQLSQIIKMNEREKYIRWVFICHYLNLEWEKRCLVAASFKNLNLEHMTTELRNFSPGQMAEYFQHILQPDVHLQNTLGQESLGQWQTKQYKSET